MSHLKIELIVEDVGGFVSNAFPAERRARVATILKIRNDLSSCIQENLRAKAPGESAAETEFILSKKRKDIIITSSESTVLCDADSMQSYSFAKEFPFVVK